MIKIQLLSLAFLLQCQTSQCASSGTYHTHKEWKQYLTVPHPAQNRILASTNKAFFSDIVEFPPASSSSFHETGPFAFLNAFLSKKRPNENGSSRIRNRKLTEENDKNPNPAQPATPPKEEGNGWWVRLDESSDTNYNLGIPSNRRSLSSTIYKFPMGGGVTPVIPQNDADAGDSADADTGTDTDTDAGDGAGDSNGTDADVSDSADAGIGTNVDAGDSVGADTDADTSESVDADTDTDADLDNQTSNILHVADSLDDNEAENTESGNEQAKDGDEEEVHGKRFLDNEETDSNHEQPLEYQEYMIISGGFTDDDWVTFPVWAYDLTASRTTGTGVWIPLHVVPADDDSKNGNESREKPKSRESDLEVGQNGDSNRNPGPSGRVGHISSMHNGYLYIFGGLTFQENQFSVDNDLIIWRAKIDHLLRDNEDENKEDSDNEPKQNPHPQLDWEIVTPHVVPDVDGATLRNLPRGEAQGTVYNSIEIDDEGNMKEKSYWIFHGGLTTKSSTAHHSHFTSIDVPLSDTWSYDFETNELKLLDTGCTVESYLECYAKPIARTAHAGAIMEDELVIYGGMTTLTDTDYFGGLGGGQKWDMLADVWSFNLITHQWKKWEIDPLLGRSYHSLVGWDGIVPDENDQKIPDKVEFEIGSGALGGEKVVFDGDEKDGRARGSVISYGGFRTYETVAGESIAFVFSDTLMAHPPSEVIPDDPFPQVSVSFWYKAQWPPGAPEAVSHRLEHTSVIDSAGNLIVWGGRFKDVNQLSGLWSLNLFGPQSKVQFKVAGPDGLDAYEAQLETLHLLVAVMLFMSVIFTALYGTLRRQAEEGGQGNRNGGRSNFLGRRRGVSQEIMDSIPVKTYVKPSRLEPTLGSEEVDACGQISSSETTNAYNEEEEECCAICLLEYQEGDKIRVFPCDHEFHKDCIDSWLENSSSCPTCRHSLYENPPSTASSSSDNNDEMRDADNSSTSDSASSSINFASLDLYRRGYVNNMGLGRRRRRNLFGTLWRNPTVHANVVDGFEAEEAQQYISTLELHEDSAIDDDIGPQTHPQNVENRSSLYPGRSRRMRNMGRNRIRRGSSGRAQTESVTLNLPLTNDSSIV